MCVCGCARVCGAGGGGGMCEVFNVIRLMLLPVLPHSPSALINGKHVGTCKAVPGTITAIMMPPLL
jgi:hypothetical protein